MSDTRALDACAKSEIIPLEEKEKREFDRLVAKFKNDPDMLSILQLGKRGWDGYVHNHCFFEGVAISGKPSGIEAQRPFEAIR